MNIGQTAVKMSRVKRVPGLTKDENYRFKV